MFDAIKSVLGEEMFPLFETALETIPEVKEILGAAAFVPLVKLDEANSKRKMAEEQTEKLQGSLTSAENEMTTLKDSVKDNQELTQRIAEAETRIKDMSTTHDKEVKDVTKRYAVLTALKDPQGHKCLIADLVVKEINLDRVLMDGGKIVAGLDEQIETLKQTYPTGFGTKAVQTEIPGDKENIPKSNVAQLKAQLLKTTKLPEKIALRRQILELEQKK